MKILLSLLLLFSIGNVQAEYRKLIVSNYTIVSDEFANDLPKGIVRIKGRVVDDAGVGLNEGAIYSMDETFVAKCDSLGNYEFYIHEIDTALFFHAIGYEEILVAGYDFKAGHTVTIDFFAKKESPKPENDIYSFKPVIYLYSEEKVSASVSFNYKGELTFTYPKYQEGWDIIVDQNIITDIESARSYPYLFWEGEMEDLSYIQNGEVFNGFLVQTDSVISFLENQLTNMGFNDRERTDFITFWSPRMTASEFNLIQFLVDDDYSENIATISIYPEPNYMKRVYLLFTALEEEPTFEITPQVFVPLKRDGFTVLEWGGSEINSPQIQL